MVCPTINARLLNPPPRPCSPVMPVHSLDWRASRGDGDGKSITTLRLVHVALLFLQHPLGCTQYSPQRFPPGFPLNCSTLFHSCCSRSPFPSISALLLRTHCQMHRRNVRVGKSASVRDCYSVNCSLGQWRIIRVMDWLQSVLRSQGQLFQFWWRLVEIYVHVHQTIVQWPPSLLQMIIREKWATKVAFELLSSVIFTVKWQRGGHHSNNGPCGNARENPLPGRLINALCAVIQGGVNYTQWTRLFVNTK